MRQEPTNRQGPTEADRAATSGEAASDWNRFWPTWCGLSVPTLVPTDVSYSAVPAALLLLLVALQQRLEAGVCAQGVARQRSGARRSSARRASSTQGCNSGSASSQASTKNAYSLAAFP